MRLKLAGVVVFLAVMAWRYRNNRAVFFAVVGSLFAAIAVVVADQVPDRILQSLALAWAACMLVAAVSAITDLIYRSRKKKGNVVVHAGREHKN
jgi:drug/metabolite transporter (DMT)-like permease